MRAWLSCAGLSHTHAHVFMLRTQVVTQEDQFAGNPLVDAVKGILYATEVCIGDFALVDNVFAMSVLSASVLTHLGMCAGGL